MIGQDYMIIDNICYNGVESEIIAINNDGTYNVKILENGNEYPHVENKGNKKSYIIGDIVWAGLEYESKSKPIIIGLTSKPIKLKQDKSLDSLKSLLAGVSGVTFKKY